MDERINNVNLLKNSINKCFEENQTDLLNVQSKMNDVESLDDKNYQTLHVRTQSYIDSELVL